MENKSCPNEVIPDFKLAPAATKQSRFSGTQGPLRISGVSKEFHWKYVNKLFHVMNSRGFKWSGRGICYLGSGCGIFFLRDFNSRLHFYLSRVVQLWAILDAGWGWGLGKISLPLIKEAALKEARGELRMIHRYFLPQASFPSVSHRGMTCFLWWFRVPGI